MMSVMSLIDFSIFLNQFTFGVKGVVREGHDFRHNLVEAEAFPPEQFQSGVSGKDVITPKGERLASLTSLYGRLNLLSNKGT